MKLDKLLFPWNHDTEIGDAWSLCSISGELLVVVMRASVNSPIDIDGFIGSGLYEKLNNNRPDVFTYDEAKLQVENILLKDGYRFATPEELILL